MTGIENACGMKGVARRDVLKGALGLSVGLGSAQLLAACSGGGDSAESLNFANWASAETATRENIDRALKVFEDQNNVQVNNIGIPFDQVLQQVTDMTKANIASDVVELSGNWPYALAAAGALTDLGPFVNTGWRKDAFPNSFEAGTYKKVLYAVPFSITPHGFWYNKDLVSQAGLDPGRPPMTIDDLNAQLTLLRARLAPDVYPIGIDISRTEYALIGFWPWIWTFGGNPMLDDGRGNISINWTDQGTVDAFQWLQNAVANRWTPGDQAIKSEREMMAFDKLVFKLDGPYLTGILGNDNPALAGAQKVNQKFAISTTPMGAGLTKPVTCADIHNLGISSLCQNKQLAWKLINFLTTSKAVISTFLIPEGGMLPYRSYNTADKFYASNYADTISQSFITRVIPTMRPPAFGPRYSTAAAAIVGALVEIAGGANVRQRLSHLNDQVRAVYA
ncbi:MAG: extracellular solute-binding protein [Ktedonobacteraceae bacterium]